MEGFQTIAYLKEGIIILAAAGIVVPLLGHLRISPVLGYLIAGFILGPYGLGSIGIPTLSYLTIANPHQVAHLAEFGVVFLLFMIGLELSLRKLWDMRRLVFGLGLLQVLLSAVIIGIIARVFGNSSTASVILGACFALSSTAIVMQILIDRQKLSTSLGRAAFSILLFQDLAVVPILILLDISSGNTVHGVGMSILIALGKAAGIVVMLVIAGRLLLRPLFRIAGAARSSEPFIAVTLLIILLTATMTGMAGLSMALGAFLGGLLLAETEYRHAIETYIEPFKGLLLGLFFMTVGMGIDLHFIAENPYWISVSVLGLIVIKAAITIPLARLFGLPWATAAETGILLSQGGEFAFVVVGSAMTLKIFSQEIGQFMLIVTSLSMMVTPWIANLGQRIDTIIQKKQEKPIDGDLYQGIPEMQGHVIIAGAGRIGRSIIRILEAESIPYIAIDNDMDVVDEKRKAGRRVYYGDASRHGLLEHFHPETAQAIVLTMEDAHDVAGAISNIRRYWQDLPIYARARDKRIARLLHKAGATMVVAETVEVSVQLSNGLLKGIGVKEPLITRRLDIERQNALIGIRGE